MKAIIMAGGEGSRLRPLTCGIPKPMVPIAGKPAIWHIINHIGRYGINDLGVTLFYLPDKIKNYLYEQYGDKIKYYVEDKPLGTAGSVKNAVDFLDETFVVMSGDVITDIDLRKAHDFHKNSGSKVTLVLTRVDIPLEYGVVITDENGRIFKFLEKPSWGEVFSDTVNTGIYIIEPEILDLIPEDKQFDFSKDLFPMLLEKKIPMYGFVSDNYWCDIGSGVQYLKSHLDLLRGYVDLGFKEKVNKDGIIYGKNVIVSENAKLVPPLIIGDNTVIDDNVVIGPYAIIGNGNYIGHGTTLKNSILWDDVKIGANNEIRGTIFCSGAITENNVRTFDNSIIGEKSKLQSFSEVKPNTKIWPNRVITTGNVVEKDVVWGSNDDTSLFGERGIKGNLYDNLMPDNLVKIGEVIGNVFEGDILVGCVDEAKSKLAYDLIKDGIKASGRKVYAAFSTILPAMRYSIKKNGYKAGVFIRNVDRDTINIIIMDENGCDIDKNIEKKIANKYKINDYKISRVINDEVPKDINKEYAEFLSLHRESFGNLNIKYMNQTTKNILTILNQRYIEDSAAANYDIGIKISDDGENVELYDDEGHMFDEDELNYLRILIGKENGKNKFVIPFNSSQFLNEVSEELNIETKFSKISPPEKMKKMFEIEKDKNDRSSQFNLSFDGINFTLKLIEYLNKNKLKLSDIKKSIPKRIKLNKVVNCDWKDKGLIIRKFYEDKDETESEFLDGIRFNYGDAWVLLVPDSELPACRIYSEAPTREQAESLLNEYAEYVNRIIESKG
ncbi:Nucleotidyl transferase [Thermoanaerobacterium thermosaccharolyticum DSM 571]|uniref:Nucleotidyl transferase n=1 Tax=Thermoanaerobacterium thermosaccharolyticum (strain ATCC 7956 / DSM 571 / NCIMB 9385 / NCA 3814 / NCTC 13789 / WDCM 00135 / 2032) TaxID=580327 RepID=D9TSW9_THETC|nr:sugar phosphate nucleotidyltransferase [Thermoanaerobacterium thermosaccharolyticum]ADL68134.1 Nucleotidyl transferase [Thermoanaerobacterium thermosaccharolyticum DSM 571]